MKAVTMCKNCGYEVNGEPSDYAPVCTPTPELPQCDECINCLLYCACNAQQTNGTQINYFTNLIEDCEDAILEWQSELQIALDSRRELYQVTREEYIKHSIDNNKF